MDPAFWLQRWQENKIGFHQDKINSRLIRLWPELDLESGAKVLVPLCGKSRDILWLAEQGFHVVGVELSEAACEDFFIENNLDYTVTESDGFRKFQNNQIELWSGDFFNLTANHLGGIVGVYDRAALIALPPEMREQYAIHLFNVLGSGAKILLITIEYDPTKMQGPPFSVTAAEVSKLFTANFSVTQLSESSGPGIVGNLQQRGLDTLDEKVVLLEKR